MDQMLKMQVVAKKMEKMLETSLQQLKSELKQRKKAEGKCLTLNERIKKLEVQLSSNEENFRATLSEKEEDIIKKLRSRTDLFKKDNDRTSLDTVNTTEKKF